MKTYKQRLQAFSQLDGVNIWKNDKNDSLSEFKNDH